MAGNLPTPRKPLDTVPLPRQSNSNAAIGKEGKLRKEKKALEREKALETKRAKKALKKEQKKEKKKREQEEIVAKSAEKEAKSSGFDVQKSKKVIKEYDYNTVKPTVLVCSYLAPLQSAATTTGQSDLKTGQMKKKKKDKKMDKCVIDKDLTRQCENYFLTVDAERRHHELLARQKPHPRAEVHSWDVVGVEDLVRMCELHFVIQDAERKHHEELNH